MNCFNQQFGVSFFVSQYQQHITFLNPLTLNFNHFSKVPLKYIQQRQGMMEINGDKLV